MIRIRQTLWTLTYAISVIISAPSINAVTQTAFSTAVFLNFGTGLTNITQNGIGMPAGYQRFAAAYLAIQVGVLVTHLL
jgi:hypothetical protein